MLNSNYREPEAFLNMRVKHGYTDPEDIDTVRAGTTDGECLNIVCDPIAYGVTVRQGQEGVQPPEISFSICRHVHG